MSSQSGTSMKKKPPAATIAPQVRRLDSTARTSKSTRSCNSDLPGVKKFTTRTSANALHLGKSACSIPDHDDMSKRNEKLKETLKKEKESHKTMKDSYEEKESELIREKYALQCELDESRKKMSQLTTRHHAELELLMVKQKEIENSIIVSHETSLRDKSDEYEKSTAEKLKIIERLKQQIAQLMQGHSNTRQAQIEDLRKKLIEASKEANELRNEICRYRESNSLPEESPQIHVGVCVNCVVMQQALSMSNSALKAKMDQLDRMQKVANNVKVGLELNDIALDSMSENQ